MPKLNLRFDALPSFESTPTFFSLPDGVDARLKLFPNVYARANSALRFNSLVGADAETIHVRSDELEHMHAAYLRAALMDYVGMEEVLPRDLKDRGISADPLRIWDTEDAMLIILRELRNIQIHCVVPLERDERVAYLPAHPDHLITLSAQMIPSNELSRLRADRNSKKYLREEFDRAVDWLASAQQHWGIADVVLQGIWSYARRIVDHFDPVDTE